MLYSYSIFCRSLEYFKSPNVTDKIAELRQSHYEQKRREKIKQITDYIRVEKIESPTKHGENIYVN